MILTMVSMSLSHRLTTRGGSCGMLVVGSFFYLPSQTRQFSILDFPIHSKSLPIAQKVEIGKSKNLPIAQNSPNLPKNLPIFNPIAKVQKLSNLKGTVGSAQLFPLF